MQIPGYPPSLPPGVNPGMPGYPLPQPTNTGSLDLSGIKPVNTGSVHLSDALAKARGFAAEKGVAYDGSRGGSLTNQQFAFSPPND
jgi:far upstream element-binding protein